MKTPPGHRPLRRNEIVRAGDLVRFTSLCAWCPVGRNTIGRKVSELTPGPKYCRAAAPDGWIACSERMPTEADGDCFGRVWWFDAAGEIDTQPYGNLTSHHAHYVREFGAGPTHWRRTHLARPQPPTTEQ